MQSSVREIRTRLLSLLVRAFVFVLFLSAFFFLVLISYFLTSSTSPIAIPFTSALQGYYIGHGSWDGVEVVFDTIREMNSLNTVLLDKDQRVILNHDAYSTLTIGSKYEILPA